MIGALDAAAQEVKKEQLLLRPDGGATMRSTASPDVDASRSKSLPLMREADPAAPAPDERGKAARSGALWRGTPFALLAEALPRLPVRIKSPALRALTLEILTVSPEAVGGPALTARLAAMRGERLYAMGQLEAADAAFREAALPKGDPARAPAEIETKLLLHGPRVACAAAAEHRAARSSPYLERAAIACHALAGAHAKAALGLGQMHERGIALGPVFGGLVIAQQPDLARPFVTLGSADAWTVRLLAETHLSWPEDAGRLGAPALLRAIAESANGPTAVRIGAAERAFLLGALDRAALVEIYARVRFRSEALQQAARLPLARYSPLKRALLFQAAMLASDRASRIEILANWWRLARADRGEMLAALITAPLLTDLVPGEEWRENAPAISRVLFYAGDLDRALIWYGWIRDASFKEMEAYMRLGAIAQLAETSGKGWTTAEAQAWAAYQRAQAAGAHRIALLQALDEALAATRGRELAAAGKKARIEDGADTHGRGAERRLAAWRDVRAAAEARREGEAILMMLTALGHDGVARAEPRALGEAVGVLAALGRQAEARRLAVEAALANGF